MALARTKLADIAYVASSAGSIYSNPSSTKTYIRSMTLFNANTTSETVKLYNVPDSAGSVGTAGATNQFAELLLSPKETLIIEWEYPIVLKDTNDSLQASTTTASKVTVMLHGDTDP
jgi:hypothetical protein